MDASDSEEQAALKARYEAATRTGESRAPNELATLETQLAQTQVVIARSETALQQLSLDDNILYATFYGLSESGQVLPKDGKWDRPRQMADIALFPNYYREVRFGALSVDGTGLPNYGEYFLVLRESHIAHRTSVLEGNAVTFLREQGFNGLDPDEDIPRGFRAPWQTRNQVGVAKLAERLQTGMTPARIRALILAPGTTTADDDFIEAHVYGPVTRRTLQRVIRRTVGEQKSGKKRKNVILKGLRKKLEGVGVKVEGF